MTTAAPTSMYEDEVPTGPTADQLKSITDFAQQQIKLAAEIEADELALKKKAAALRKLEEIDLPNAMQEAGCKAFTLNDGSSITIKKDIAASVSAAKKPTVCKWLRDNGYGDIVSEDISIAFGRGEEAKAKALLAELIDKGLVPECVTNVNTARMKSLIKEEMAAGKDMPLDLLGAYEWVKAIIKPPK